MKTIERNGKQFEPLRKPTEQKRKTNRGTIVKFAIVNHNTLTK